MSIPGRRQESEQVILPSAGDTKICRQCGTRKHVRVRPIDVGLPVPFTYIPLCRRCRHQGLEDVLDEEELKGVQLLQEVLGG